MSDAIDRARDIIERYLPAMPDQQAALVTRDAARALDAAGMLVSPERDAAVAVRALRGAADDMDDTDDPDAIHVANGDIDKWLRARADRLDREAGESNADA